MVQFAAGAKDDSSLEVNFHQRVYFRPRGSSMAYTGRYFESCGPMLELLLQKFFAIVCRYPPGCIFCPFSSR